jgi:predicted nucleic acid-binding protein
VIYLDSSVAIAFLLGEDRQPRKDLWQESLSSSRLLEYEVWNRVHARNLADIYLESIRAFLERISLTDLDADVLGRAREPFPVHVRTLDALHLATIVFLRGHGQELELASYDNRLNAAAMALRIPLYRF